MDYIAVKNFSRFQTYKKRGPLWIKLYMALLDDYDFGLLPDASKFHLIGIWLLAGKLNNKIPSDTEWIAQRIGSQTPIDLEVLMRRGFIQTVGQVGDKSVATPRLNSSAEKRREETETEKRQSTGTNVPGKPSGEKEADRILTQGDVLAAVRKVLWAPDGKPPADWSEGREMTVIRALMKRGETADDLLRAVLGLQLMQNQGEVDWLKVGTKITLRAVYNSKNKSREMLTQALDAAARGAPIPTTPRTPNGVVSRVDFGAAFDHLRGAH